MLMSIGELADRSGVSRRMLRHWDDLGLLEPAEVDPLTGYRRYAASQTGRVGAIRTLRGWGFRLDEVGQLLTDGLTADALVALLRTREGDLIDQIRVARTNLAAVRRRLRSIERGIAMSATSLHLQALPALRLRGQRAQVGDETEIGSAVAELTAAVRAVIPDAQLIRTYYGPPEGGPLEVFVGVESDEQAAEELELVEVPESDRGVAVELGPDTGNIGDAWLALDAALLQYGLTTTGPHRHLTGVRVGSIVTLQAPVVSTRCEPDV